MGATARRRARGLGVRRRCFSQLPGGRPAADPKARERRCARYGMSTGLAHRAGSRRGEAGSSPGGRGDFGALVIGGVELADLPDPVTTAALRSNPHSIRREPGDPGGSAVTEPGRRRVPSRTGR